MTTPHPAISEAREALNRACRVPQQYPSRDDLLTIQAAIDLAESQAAEIERLKADKYVRFTAKMSELETDNAMLEQRLKVGELAYMKSIKAERDRLKSALESAEKVIKPFAEMLNQKHPPEYADGRHAWGFNGKDLMWGDFNRAAQWSSLNALEET